MLVAYARIGCCVFRARKQHREMACATHRAIHMGQQADDQPLVVQCGGDVIPEHQARRNRDDSDDCAHYSRAFIQEAVVLRTCRTVSVRDTTLDADTQL